MAEKEQRDRRQYPRSLVRGGLKGRFTFDEAVLINVSLGGAVIEHAQIIRPGIRSDLRLFLLGRDVSLRSHVVRSVVHRRERQPDGEETLLYRTGLEFLELSDEAQQLISDFIQWLIEPALALSSNQGGRT